MNDPWATLGDLYDHLWERMGDGVADSSHPFRFVTLATQGGHGPEARMVGLRRSDRDSAEVEVHSDVRTAKIKALRRDPRAAVLLWDATAQLQIRLQIEAKVEEADAARWSRVPPPARRNYGTDPAPGTPIPDSDALTRTPDVARFAAIVGRVVRIDAVSLAHDPHRRAIFDGPTLRGRWVAP